MRSNVGASTLVGVLVAGLGLGVAGPALADPLGVADGFNAFVLHDMHLTNTDAGGRVAVGGNGSFTNFAVGSGNNGSNGVALSPDGTRLDLIIAGNGTLTNGSIQKGSALVSGTVQQQGIGYPTSGASLRTGESPIDFAAAATALQAEAQWLQTLAPTGTVSKAYSTLTLQGGDAGLNVFNLTAADLLNISTLQIVVPAAATILVNVAGSTVNFSNMGMFVNGSQSSAQRADLLWNFADTQQLNLSNLQWSGSILAPSATVHFTNGQLNGQIIAWGLETTGELHNVAFAGSLPDKPGTGTDGPLPVPEPSTVLLTFGGCALLGVSVYRRRQALRAAPAAAAARR